MWHTLPPGDPKKEAFRGLKADVQLRSAIENAVDENDKKAKQELRVFQNLRPLSSLTSDF